MPSSAHAWRSPSDLFFQLHFENEQCTKTSGLALCSPRGARTICDGCSPGAGVGGLPLVAISRKRIAEGETQRSVARSYNVSQATISRLAVDFCTAPRCAPRCRRTGFTENFDFCTQDPR